MEYLARHYVKIAGRVMTPGEIFTAEDGEKMERLVRIGAVSKIAETEETSSVLPCGQATHEAASWPESATGGGHSTAPKGEGIALSGVEEEAYSAAFHKGEGPIEPEESAGEAMTGENDAEEQMFANAEIDVTEAIAPAKKKTGRRKGQ